MEHAFKEHLQEIARRHEHVKLNICYSDPSQEEVKGKDYHQGERVSVELFKRLLPSNNYDFFICGPPPMMQSLTEGLRGWGVPDEQVHFEAFGPASVKRVTAAHPEVKAEVEKASAAAEIVFAKSNKTIRWEGQCTSVLELAEAHGVRIDSGCRAGNCGTCLTAIKSGKVKYPQPTGYQPEAGSCLTCICVPDGSLVLDA